MNAAASRSAHLILLSLFVTALGNSAMIPFMAYFIMQELHLSALHVTGYSVAASLLTMLCNRVVGERIDRGGRIVDYVVIGNVGLMTASLAVLIMPAYPVVLLAAAPCLALAGAGISAVYILGRLFAERNGLDVQRFNAKVRTMVSTGWMFGPALSYLIAARGGSFYVFVFVLILAIAALATTLVSLPRDFRADRREPRATSEATRWFDNRTLWLAAAACFLFNIAHVLCASALPLFYIREAHLPVYAPGLSLTFKCLAEVVAIMGSPYITERMGRRNALYLSAIAGMAAFAVLHEATSLPLMALGALMEGAYFGLFAGVAVSFMQGFARGRIGRATSLYMNSLFLSSLTASTLTGVIATAFSFQAAIAAAGVAMTAALAMLFLTRRADAEAEA
jgi:SET family sugar efflux transporter-like MFS transporter